MGASKSDLFNAQQNRLSELFKALSHPARIAIVEHLQKIKGCICSDIVEELPLSQPTISQHLKALKQAGIIKGRIEGSSICYCLDADKIAEIQSYFALLLREKSDCDTSTC
jgi:DNA-binding transcriptional ArsR family regulator